MFPFSKLPPADTAEKKALTYAALCSLLFICFLVAVRVAMWEKHSPRVQISKKVLLSPEPPPPVDSFEKYRVKPENFYPIDFWNYSYGLYTLRDGKRINLTLVNSELELPNNSDLFWLKDVYYRDVTGDGKAEAIVWLSHVHCAGSCDGGSNLFYIYTVRDGKPKSIWQYETGSYAYGCALKSLTLSGKQIDLELFGHCTQKEMEAPGPSKFTVEGSTFILFEYDGQHFVQQSIGFFDASPTNVKNYEPDIRIF